MEYMLTAEEGEQAHTVATTENFSGQTWPARKTDAQLQFSSAIIIRDASYPALLMEIHGIRPFPPEIVASIDMMMHGKCGFSDFP